jgi:serine protease AprX
LTLESELFQRGRRSAKGLCRAFGGRARTRGDRAEESLSGSLEVTRGGNHLEAGGVQLSGDQLSGERSIFGPFSSAAWAQQSAARTTWSGGVWMGYRMAGDTWTGTGSWSDPEWAERYWTGHYWTGHYWSGHYWTGHYWSGDDWSTSSWS